MAFHPSRRQALIKYASKSASLIPLRYHYRHNAAQQALKRPLTDKHHPAGIIAHRFKTNRLESRIALNATTRRGRATAQAHNIFPKNP